jgi:hypothetical protein
MARRIHVSALGRSFEGPTPQDKMSYQVVISEGDRNVVVEARISLGTLETLSDPEKRLEKWFDTRPLPQTNCVIDILSL